MTLPDSDRNLLSQALALAASNYETFARDARAMPGGDRLSTQFVRQAITARKYAILIGDANEISIGGLSFVADAELDARKITDREVEAPVAA